MISYSWFLIPCLLTHDIFFYIPYFEKTCRSFYHNRGGTSKKIWSKKYFIEICVNYFFGTNTSWTLERSSLLSPRSRAEARPSRKFRRCLARMPRASGASASGACGVPLAFVVRDSSSKTCLWSIGTIACTCLIKMEHSSLCQSSLTNFQEGRSCSNEWNSDFFLWHGSPQVPTKASTVARPKSEALNSKKIWVSDKTRPNTPKR